jgi:hypothetical protein
MSGREFLVATYKIRELSSNQKGKRFREEGQSFQILPRNVILKQYMMITFTMVMKTTKPSVRFENCYANVVKRTRYKINMLIVNKSGIQFFYS